MNSLASIGDTNHVHQHIDVIHEGLPHYYGPAISVVKSKLNTKAVDEVEALLAHELSLDKFKKKTINGDTSSNLTHASILPAAPNNP